MILFLEGAFRNQFGGTFATHVIKAQGHGCRQNKTKTNRKAWFILAMGKNDVKQAEAGATKWGRFLTQFQLVCFVQFYCCQTLVGTYINNRYCNLW